MKRVWMVFSLCLVTLGLPFESKANDAWLRTIKTGDVCEQEKQIEGILSDQPLICTLGMWRPVRIDVKPDSSVKPIIYNGTCKLRLDPANRSRNRVIVKAGEIIDICLPDGLKSHLIALSNSHDFHIAQPVLISNLVIVKAAKKASTSLWIYPVNGSETDEEKFEIQLLSK